MKRIVLLLLVGACGSSDPPGEPLISSTITASYDGHAFTPTFGFATIYKGSGLIGFADSSVHCGSETSPNPPPGSGVIADVTTLDVGSYTSASFEIYRNVGGFTAVGSSGDVEITESTTTSVVGSITYSFTDPSDNKMYSASGTFEVKRCP